jgi:hypothetical protein
VDESLLEEDINLKRVIAAESTRLFSALFDAIRDQVEERGGFHAGAGAGADDEEQAREGVHPRAPRDHAGPLQDVLSLLVA